MITPEQALVILQDTVKNGTVHRDYNRVTELADWYFKIVTGVGIEELLKKFVRREDDVMFDQRKELTIAITPAVAETLTSPFFRLGRLDNIKKSISSEGNDKQVQEVKDCVAAFWGKESLDKYIATRFIQMGKTDPNAWVIVEFDSFDARYEKARPYPVEVSSKEAINFSVVNNECQWLIIKTPYQIKVKDVYKEGYQYTMYLANDILQYTPYFDGQEFIVAGFSENNALAWNIGEKKYTLAQYQPRGGEVQAVRVGYIPDPVTDDRTFVNYFHAAKPYFEKTIKTVSEMDLSMSLHAFQQKIQRVEECPGMPKEPCYDGYTEAGLVCKKCGGTGKDDIHKSAQDIITVPFPDKGDPKPITLDDIIKYHGPEVGLLVFQDQYIDKLEIKAIKAVFNSDVISKTTVVQTATERIENKDEMYNTLHPCAEHISKTYKKFVRLIAAFTDNLQGLIVQYEHPSDYKFKTVNEMLADLKQAKDSGASHFVIQQLEKDIAAKLYADDDIAFLKYLVKTRFISFLGKSEETIKWLFETGRVRKEDEVLWSYSDAIFDELEEEVEGFFLMTSAKQWPYIQAKVKALMEALPKDTMALEFRADGFNPDELNAPDIEAEAKAKLRGSVGGTQGILEIQASVASGVTQYEAAVTLLYQLYGFDDATSRKLLGNPTALKAAEAPVQ